MKPGYKTTEFWLTLAAGVIGALLLADVFVQGSTPFKLLTAFGTVLNVYGYRASRISAKAADARGVVGSGGA